MHHKQKSVILTGSSGLLGSAITDILLTNNWHVIAIDLKKPEHIPDGMSFISFDLTQIDSYYSLKKNIIETSHNIKGLINNAAANPTIDHNIKSFGKFEDIDLNEWHHEIQLNLNAPVFLIKMLLDVFNHDDGQHCKIVNMISTYGIVPPNQDIYQPLSQKKGLKLLNPFHIQ
ncbi:MAG: hypothetical protein OMM_00857 [Candidatus Magnetoglobus multicellularis str. Araruama]|uniref:Uncharacterized protein n=1 Tax=Candidatus Magnetoglobus multicellularis str. Araruama TaxID=890399 RepID=A0A1V1PF74_9BACT|nr:MAG: hypothetical protein OMM_00857 [Candidatus Magnetoglobus multicellularis str. Araruama]